MSAPIGIYVLAHPKKACVTSDTLRTAGVSHKVCVNKDWWLPLTHAEWRTDRTWRPSQRDYAIRQYRVIRGHQEILRNSTHAITVVMEDDMTAMPENFMEHVQQACDALLLPDNATVYDAVSFHGRNLSPHTSVGLIDGREYVVLQPRVIHEKAQQEYLSPLWRVTTEVPSPLTLKWHEGCLMYAVGRAGKSRWSRDPLLTGWPCDLFLVNKLNTAVLLHSPVVHSGESLMTQPIVK